MKYLRLTKWGAEESAPKLLIAENQIVSFIFLGDYTSIQTTHGIINVVENQETIEKILEGCLSDLVDEETRIKFYPTPEDYERDYDFDWGDDDELPF